ncbi:MAG: DUF305 domain-containing protein [Pseudonocardia sp.]|nr:DUF305 domain-containing protein [Pseudonocardia sp.]
MNRTTLFCGLTAVLAAVALAGCGSTTAPSATSSSTTSAATSATTQHNDADVAFVQGMVPHHSQAVAMSQLVAGHTSNPKLIDLATQIAQAQGPEITQMQGFLQSWNVPAAPTGGMGGMAGSGSAMPGMMSDQQMQQLGAANGAAFEVGHRDGDVRQAGECHRHLLRRRPRRWRLLCQHGGAPPGPAIARSIRGPYNPGIR